MLLPSGNSQGRYHVARVRGGSGGGYIRSGPILRNRIGKLGVEGGTAPSPAANVERGVCWLVALSLRQVSLGAPPKRPSGHRHGTTPIEQSRTSSSASLFASLQDGEGNRPARLVTARDCATLCRAAEFPPTPTPRRPEIVDPARSLGPYIPRNAPPCPQAVSEHVAEASGPGSLSCAPHGRSAATEKGLEGDPPPNGQQFALEPRA